MKALWLALPLFGCVDASEPQLLPEGTTGVDRVGRNAFTWTVINGEKIVDDDFSLGPAGESAHLYAAASTLSLWPSNNVPYCIDNGIGGNPCLIRQAIADLSVVGASDTAGCVVSHGRGLTPLSFNEQTCSQLAANFAADPSAKYIRYEGGTTPTGKDTTVAVTHGFDIILPSYHMRSVQHETGHALGLFHEQKRKDRDQHIDVISDCFKTGPDDDTTQNIANQFVKVDGSLLTPYDADSVMQYASVSFSSDDDMPPNTLTSCPAHPNSTNVNTCPSMLFKDGVPASTQYCTDVGWKQGAYRQFQTLGLSPDDVNALYQLYEMPNQGTCLASERMGAQIASGDLDGDGYADLAVNVGNSVRLYKGTMNGLVYWRSLGAADFGAGAGSSDQFGASLAVGGLSNLNPGGKLFVGAPGYNGGHGAVFVYQPTAAVVGINNGRSAKPSTGTEPFVRIDAPSGETKFGRALALGSFSALDQQELAIGVVDSAGGNRVEIQHWTGTQFLYESVITHAGASDGFGSELAAGDLNGDGIDELAVAAPSAVVNGAGNGIVYVYTFTHLNPGTPAQVYEAAPFGTSDRFGAALRIGRWKANGGLSLNVGAPDAGPGRVVTFAWDPAQNKLTNRGMVVGGANGDGFGTAIRIGDMDNNGTPDLIVGAPSASTHGTVSIFRDTGGSPAVLFGQAGDAGFGAAIGLANYDGPGKTTGHEDTLDLAIGAPRSSCSGNANAGAITFLAQRTDVPLELQLERRFTLTGASPASVIP